MQNTESGVTATLCSEVNIYNSQSKVSFSKITNVLVCSQSIFNNHTKSLSGELLCLKN
jgi:hypothetical protein